MTKTLRRILLSAGLSTGLLAAAASAATTHPILAGNVNHCQPLVHSRQPTRTGRPAGSWTNVVR